MNLKTILNIVKVHEGSDRGQHMEQGRKLAEEINRQKKWLLGHVGTGWSEKGDDRDGARGSWHWGNRVRFHVGTRAESCFTGTVYVYDSNNNKTEFAMAEFSQFFCSLWQSSLAADDNVKAYPEANAAGIPALWIKQHEKINYFGNNCLTETINLAPRFSHANKSLSFDVTFQISSAFFPGH